MPAKISVVLGTAKENNFSTGVAKVVFDHISQKDDIEAKFVDVKDFLFGKTVTTKDNADLIQPWKDIVAESDAIIFVSPEYNHSYPGELKILIDSLFDEYKGKVAGVVGVSMGPYSGVRAVEALKMVLHTTNFKLVLKSVNVPGVRDGLDEESIKKHTDGLLEEIIEKVGDE